MPSHRRKRTAAFKALTKRQWLRLAAGCTVITMVIGAGFASRGYYQAQDAAPHPGATAFSATQPEQEEVSRGSVRQALSNRAGGSSAGTSYVRVQINGANKLVLGEHFTTVKSVLDAGNITLDPDDQITPSLDEKVSESTTIKIERADSTVQTEDSAIPFNTIEEKTDSLPSGTQKVKTEGKEGVMETTSLVTKAGSKNLSSNVFASFVKEAPVNKVIQVGTGSTSPGAPAGASATTAPVGDSQSIAHGLVLSHGWSEGDFTCLVQLWNKESGWRTNAANPSGAYGIPQALPGSKMASAGPDWQNNPTTQITWGLGYIAGRYGSPCGAWSQSQSAGWY
ncbi:G5 domain-containing protein [Bombiscardovia nodaiensis]|uniref:G5 domain-containing protein n=1 Tax=Bombiscardovia nodaiensis TaxID=2932181 RepID=A0ABM8B9F1_9BIFI|nr:G5 domain-containing protein [Bombiscardovia nodaiensis]